MKTLTKKILTLTLFVLISMSTYSQDRWTIGVGYGKSQAYDISVGDEFYLSGTYKLNNSWALTSRLSHIQSETFSVFSFVDSKTKTITFQPEINWIIIKSPFILYPSFGITLGGETSTSGENLFLWGTNLGLNFDVPVGRFLIGTRFAGNTMNHGNYGNAFLSLSGVVKFRLGKK